MSPNPALGKDLLPHVHHGTKDKGGVYRFGPEFLAYEKPRQQKKDGIDDHDYQGDLYCEPRGVEKVAYHYGKTRDGTNHQFGGKQEVIHCCRQVYSGAFSI